MTELGNDSASIQLNDLSESNGQFESILEHPQQSSESKLLTNLRRPSNININFSDINYTVTAWTFRENGFPIKRERKIILKGISGDFQANELTGIIGPSGSGKTSLLNILSGFSQDFTGKVEFNGESSGRRRMRKHVAYIMQDCSLQPLLTVREAMVSAAHLKLGVGYTVKEKLTIIEEVLTTLHLIHKVDSRADTLSGGEKKRFAIALELVNNPAIMFFDEPTSGLDYFTAKKCLQYLKQLARRGHNIVCSLHQPSAAMFELLDHMYVLADGRCMYQGSTKGLTAFLHDLGLSCPEYHNPADHVLDLSVGEFGPYMDRLVEKINNGKSREWRKTAVQLKEDSSKMLSDRNQDCLEKTSEDSYKNLSHHSLPFFAQFSTLVLRMFTIIHRDKFFTYFRIGIHCAVGCLLGSFYFGIGSDATYIFDNFCLLFFSLMFLMFTALSSMIISFPLELPIIVREYFNHWYSLKSYYLALSVTEIPIQIICTSAYCVIMYLLSEQPLEWFRFGMLCLMYTTVTLFTQALGVLIGTIFPIKHGVIAGPVIVLPWLIFSGFFLHLSDAPHYLQWLFHISYFKYGIEGLMQAIYGYDRDKLPCSSDYCHFRFPRKFLKQMDMQDADYWVCLSVIAGFYVASKLVTYFVLRYRLTHYHS